MLKYEDLLFEYEVELNHLLRKKRQDIQADNFVNLSNYDLLAKNALLWYHKLIIYTDFHVCLCEVNEQEKSIYDILPNFPLVGIINYRNKKLPIYFDDSGQQYFSIYKNIEYFGGAYNNSYAEDICLQLDEIIDQERMEENYEKI